MGNYHFGCLDCPHCHRRALFGVHLCPQGLVRSMPLAFSTSQEIPSVSRNSAFVSHSGHRTGSRKRTRDRVLLDPVPGPQIIGQLARHSEFTSAQPKYSVPSFQNAFPQFPAWLHSSRGFHAVGRPEGSVPACSNSLISPEIPPLLFRGPSFPVPGNAFRTVFSSTHVHKAPGGGCSVSPTGSSALGLLSRRHPDSIVVSGTGDQRQTVSTSDSSNSWIHTEFRQKSSFPDKTHSASWSDNRFGAVCSLPLARPAVQHKTPGGPDSLSQICNLAPSLPASGQANLLHRHCSLGAFPSAPASVVSAPLPEAGTGGIPLQGEGASFGSSFPEMVAFSKSRQGLVLPGSGGGGSHHGCESSGLGGPPSVPTGPRNLVTGGNSPQHQLARVAGSPSGPASLPTSSISPPPVGFDRQCGHQGSYQQAGGNSFLDADARSGEASGVGGSSSPIVESGTHLRLLESRSRLAQQGSAGSRRMAVGPLPVPGPVEAVRDATSGPVCHGSQHSTPEIFFPLPVPGSGGSRRPEEPLAPGSSVCLPASSNSDQGNQKGDTRKSRYFTRSAALASSCVVRRPPELVSPASLANASGVSSVVSGRGAPSRSRLVPLSRVAFERIRLIKGNLSNDVISIIQAARRPSTVRIYNASWDAFSRWCLSHHVDPTTASVPEVLQFLHAGFSKGLATATLRRQVAALATVLLGDNHIPLSQDSRVRSFLLGVSNLRPPPIHRFPTWDLSLVLQALTSPPFEPLVSITLRNLTLKMAFLLAVTSARRVSEIAAFSMRSDLCIFFPDRVVLRLDPAFIPKVNTRFHRAQEIVLPNFCPDPRHSSERRWHTLDVRRALKHYLRRTESIRKTEALLVSFLPSSLGQKVSSTTVGRWLKSCISEAYGLRGAPVPEGILPHSTRSAATSAAWATQASVDDICRAATWSSLSSFVRHYRLDLFASADASFGRRVLQSVISPQGGDQAGIPPSV